MKYGYGFFDLVNQYWYACIALFGRTCVMHHALSQVANRDLHLPDRTRLVPLPLWLNPEPYAANIASNAEHYFHPAAGLWGAQQAAACMGMALYYYAATDGQDSPEMLKMRTLLMQKRNGQTFAMGFLRSTAATPSLGMKDGKGNLVDAGNAEGRRLLARIWCGMEHALGAGTVFGRP